MVTSKCSAGHSQSWKCGKGKPTSCRKCENEKRAKERKIKEEYIRQQKREQEEQEHATQMAKLEDELRQVREAAADARKAKEMAQSLEQKKQDLENAKRLIKLSQSLPMVVGSATVKKHPPPLDPMGMADHATVGEAAESIDPHPKVDQHPPKSTSEVEWERQKRVENVTNDAIDSLMQMTGLEEVKAQVLKIKTKIDTASRQSTNMKDERYGVVLLGNPGTGKFECLQNRSDNSYGMAR